MKLSEKVVGIFVEKGWSVVNETHTQSLFFRKIPILNEERTLKISISPDVSRFHLIPYFTRNQQLNELLSSLRREAPFFLEEDELEAVCLKLLEDIEVALEPVLLKVA
ncbi:hypothetical protein ACTG16_22500 [Aeromonas sp. 23P]|uniref:hypothetical protein n=1 Tax=Aeromonas sp. 23P TaxID=3452716 RepID=UPI003F78D4CF|nr:hypothetical protein [Aeromonas veronii]